MQPVTRRKTLGFLFIVLLAAAARATAVVADEDPISTPIGTVSNTAMSTDEAWAIRISDAASSATDPGSTIVSDPIASVADTVSDPIASVSDTVSDPIASVSDTVSGATGAVSDTVSGATGAVSSATGRGSDHGLGVGASTRGNTPIREGQDLSCDAQTNTCIPDAAGGGSLAGVVERILGFLALTGWEVLPWIVIAVGLTALGIFLLRSSRRRTSRT